MTDTLLHGQRLARQFLFTHGGVVGEAGNDGSGLFQITGFHMIQSVQFGVMGLAEVVQTVLDELEAGQADPVKRDMVGAAGIGQNHVSGAQIVEGFEPVAEDGRCGVVFLGVNATDATGTIVEIEIGRELVIGTGGLEFAGRSRKNSGSLICSGSVGSG